MALSQKFYINNRKKLGKKLKNNSIAILYSGREILMSEDAVYPFYYNNNFYYLTGITDSEVTLVLLKDGHGELKEKLFIKKPDLEQEKWIGKKINADLAFKRSGILDIVFNEAMSKAIKGRSDLKNLYFDFKVPAHQSFKTNDEDVKAIIANLELKDLYPQLAMMRMFKDPEEIAAIKKANALTKKAFNEMKKEIKPGIYEYELAAFFEYCVKKQGAKSLAFESIVASGKNATTLHYVSNQEVLKSKELILFDLGARWEGYCADISRTISVDGEMTLMQSKVLNSVKKVQKELIKAYKPGVSLKSLQDLTKELFLEECIDMGLRPANNKIEEFYYHGIGHPLGLDTHDIRTEDPLVLSKAMVMTVEPGLYIKSLGLGIRIEDDLLITENGCEVF